MVGVPWHPQVAGLFPNAVQLTLHGNNYLAVPHEEDNVFLLRKFGFDVAAPIYSNYDWPHPPGKAPFDVQKKTCALLTMAERAYVLNGMGTGKTKCPIWSWDYLHKNKRAKRMLVVAPLSTLKFTWEREIWETLGAGIKVAVLHGTREQRFKALADPSVHIFVVNHDGIKIIADELKKYPDIDTLCIDELAAFRNNSDRTKVMIKVAQNMKWVWGMTGSPIPHAPTDVFQQAKIITPHTVPTYFSHFRQDLMYKIDNTMKWVAKKDAVEKAFAAMQPAVRFTIDEVAELPECITRFVDVDMGKLQKKTYVEIMNHCQAAVQGGQITAANAGAAMMKLLQISLGWVYSSDQKVIPLDNDVRIQALLDIINSTDRKVLVFSPFKHALAGISEVLDNKKNKIDHATVSGDTPAGNRAQIFNLFQNSTKYKVLNAHPACLAHGITLTAADTVIWFGPVTSLEIYDQANHRIKRVGQKHKQNLWHLQGSPVEKKIYRLLQGHQDVQNSFLKMFEEGNEEW